VPDVKRQHTLLAAAAGGALGAYLLRNRRSREAFARARAEDDPRADLRRKLAEARAAPSDEDDFEVAGMAAETVVEDDGPPSGRDVDALRRRVHAAAQAAAEEVKRRGGPES
jgi:hypothetical protein